MLNNKDTGEPLTLMSANLLSSARTGAVPGVASRYVVDREAQVVSVLGCGPINRACVEGILSQLPGITRVSCFDINRQAAKALADWVSERFGVKAIVVDDLPESLADADVVSVAASRLVPLHVEEAWFKPTATIMLTGPMLADEALWTNSRIVYDHIQLQEAYVEEGEASGDKENYYSGVIGGPLYRLIDAGKLPALRESTDLGAIVSGREPGRGAEDGRIVFVTCGMAVYDLAWGFDVYRTALDKGIGTTLKLWDEPLSR
jgi:ornithine cyclodeaminase